MSDAEQEKPHKRKTAAEIRHIKRAQQKQAIEGTDQTRQNAHLYLQQWSNDPTSWKFNKAKQLWITRHLYLESHLPQDIFEIALRYLNNSGDVLRRSLVENAQLIAEPARATSEELMKARTKALGLLPKQVTKAEANAMKRAKNGKKVEDKPKEDGKEEEKKEENSDSTSAIAVQRAELVISTLTGPKPSEESKEKKDKSKDKKDKKKRKHKDDDDTKSKKKKKKSKKD